MDCLGPQPTLLGNGSTEGVPLFIVLLITLALAHLLPLAAKSSTGLSLGPNLLKPCSPIYEPGLVNSARTGFIPALVIMSPHVLYLPLLSSLVASSTVVLPIASLNTGRGPNIVPANNVLI